MQLSPSWDVRPIQPYSVQISLVVCLVVSMYIMNMCKGIEAPCLPLDAPGVAERESEGARVKSSPTSGGNEHHL